MFFKLSITKAHYLQQIPLEKTFADNLFYSSDAMRVIMEAEVFKNARQQLL